MKSDQPTTSLWKATVGTPERSSLTEHTSADVCIIGAGIAGISTAYWLTREGMSVVVLDNGPIGGGMTMQTTAHLVNALDDRYYDLEKHHGEKGAWLAADSHSVAIDRIEAAINREGIDCDFERLDGYLFVPPGDSIEELHRELAAIHRAGLAEVELVDRAPIESFDTGPCLRFPRQAQFHPLKYIVGLTQAIEKSGGRIFTGTRVTKIEGGTPARVETETGWTITAGAVVVATNTPINNIVAIHTKQAPYTTYAIAARIPHGTVAKALYWDTAQESGKADAHGVVPYHYVRLQKVDSSAESSSKSHDVLIIGGEDHKTGQADDADVRYRRLEAWARERWPTIENIEFWWSGQVMEPIDGLAFIGRNPMDDKNIYIATGDSGNGMTHGTIAGLLLTDMINGRENDWATLYDPSRKTLRAAPYFASENLNVAGQYAKGYLTGGEVDSVEEIRPGEGAIIRQGLTKSAAYRDDKGVLHQCSAVCTHLGCIVAWNSNEKSWDCPCHGSRFDSYGRVITGPATSDLTPVDE